MPCGKLGLPPVWALHSPKLLRCALSLRSAILYAMACSTPPIPRDDDSLAKRKVFCVKFQREMPGLDEIPFEGHEIGQKIFDSVSKEAWKMWLEHMKMLMNEYRLNLATQEAQEFLIQQMDSYFFGPGAVLPPDYVPPKSKN